MRQMPPLTIVFALPLFFLFLSSTAHAHNITSILAKNPEFSTFNHYLTLTHLAPEINRRLTITVLAVDNAAMSPLLSKHLSLSTIKSVLSLHVLVDYLGSTELHHITNGTALIATLFQATGSAPGSSWYVNITGLKSGKVGFCAADNIGGKLDAEYVKVVHENPYNISILHISQTITSILASAPCPAPDEPNDSSQKNTIWIVLGMIGFILVCFFLRALCRGCLKNGGAPPRHPPLGVPIPTVPSLGVPIMPTAPPLEVQTEMPQRFGPYCPSCGYDGAPYLFQMCPSCGFNSAI